MEAKPGDPTYMIGVQENKVTRVPLVEAVAMVGGPLTAGMGLILTFFLDESCRKGHEREGFH